MNRYPRRFALLWVALAFFTSFFFTLVDGERPKIETHEDVIKSREKRRRQLENVLQNMKQKLEDHQSGKKPLSDRAVEQFQKKIRAYEHQIVELGREMDPEDIERILENGRRRRSSGASDEL
mmetsp:Transcript_24549/g.43077  ORF Transcript_24549/g.43077 Transcript_24549/m.43077 type:complete len:122 (-) Transcript_24549:121-486(-)